MGQAFFVGADATVPTGKVSRTLPVAAVLTHVNVESSSHQRMRFHAGWIAGDAGDLKVTVLPITHTPPSDLANSVEISPDSKRQLGLDDQASWIVINEANRFVWPGPDLRLGPSGDAATVAYGLLPRALFKRVQDGLSRAIEARLLSMVARTH